MWPGLGVIRVVSINVNGLQTNVAKRKAFFQYLTQVAAYIVVVQETHCGDDNQARRWVQQGGGPGMPWNGPTFWQHYSTSSRGVGILLKAGVVPDGHQPTVEYTDDQAEEPGRVLRVGWDLPNNQHLSVLAVYAPCEAPLRSAFFSGPFADAALQPQHLHSHLIVAGDFNCVLSTQDIQPAPGQPASASGRLQGAQDMQLVCHAAAVQDAWRTLHPQLREYTHHTAGQHTSAGRIDAVWVSNDMLDAGWVTRADHLHDAPIGDHSAVLVELRQPDTPPLGQRRWIFPHDLLGRPAALTDLRTAILQYKQTWQPQAAAQPGQAPPEVQRWEDLKAFVRQQSIVQQKQLQQQRQADRRVLVHQLRTARRMQCLAQGAATTARLLSAKRALQLYDQHQARSKVACQDVVHEMYGETSTFYFHRLGKPPRESGLICEVNDPTQPGSTVRLTSQAGTQAAADIFADFYDAASGGLFTAHPTVAADQQLLLAAIDKQLSLEEQQQCLGDSQDGSITTQEAEAALHSLPRGKAPGSDGLTYEFYAAFWPEVGDWLLAAFNAPYLDHAQLQPQLSESQRMGLISLVYKGGGQPRSDPNSYRPITLLNCDLKIMAKVQVLRIGSVLPSVIDSTQTAFVPGRQIADNVLCHLEEIDYLQQQQQPGVIMFLDFAKAYDRLNRTWLQLCMQHMSFPAGCIRWVQLLLQGTQARIMFNRGQLSRRIAIDAGCAQGSPLSPLLYVIAAQPLSARCRQLQQAAAFSSIQVPGGQAAPCCHQHADDTTLHAADVASIKYLLDHAVQPFCRATAGQLNISKSTAMVMGSHPHLTGVEPTTGVTFVDTIASPVRHLGILLSASGTDAFADRMYGQRLQLIAWRVKLWSQHNLTLQGRLEVAKQVLASCLSYHQQFVQPPEAIMQRIMRVISAFVLGRGMLPDGDALPLRGCPSRVVACLPKDMGGVAQVDIRTHCLALQGKVAAMLLHPRKAVWKQFMSAALNQALPGTGILALIQPKSNQVTAAVRAGRLSARHAGYIRAFQQVGVHRRTPHQAMSQQQVLLEPLIGNYSVAAAADGQPFLSLAALPPAVRGPAQPLRPRQLRDVLPVLQLTPALDGLVLPQQWHATLTGPAAASQWQCAQAGAWVRGAQGLYKVRDDASLLQVAALPGGSAAWQWTDCCVVNCDPCSLPSMASDSAQDADEPPPDLWLVGEWQHVLVDPSVWCLGTTMGVLQYTVKQANKRLLQFQCSTLPGWEPGAGMRPRLCRTADGRPSATAFADMETGQKRTWEDMQAAPSSSRQVRVSDAELMDLYEANWMRESPARLLPRQRVQQAAAVRGQITLQRQQQQQQVIEPAVNDLGDPLLGSIGPNTQIPMPFQAMWKAVWSKRLPRHLRIFAWRLLHAALPVGAVKARFVRPGNVQQLLQQCCQHPACQAATPQPPLETLSHVLVHCPVAVRAWQWMRALWLRLDPAVGPLPLDQQLLVLGQGQWAPADALGSLWDYLRILMLHSLWTVRCSSAGTPSHTAHAVVSKLVAAVRHQVAMDWQRVESDIRWGTGLPFTWFLGRDPSMTTQAFQSKWCKRGVLVSLPAAGSTGAAPYRFHLSAAGV